MIGIVDYHAGNASSVAAALDVIGAPNMMIRAPGDLDRVGHVILPGVGSARATLDSLKSMGLLGPLKTFVMDERKPFLGICIGLQVLLDNSEESDTACLGWIPGDVRVFDSASVRVPQIGWNEVTFRRRMFLLEDVPDGSYCYFVNSYHAFPGDPDAVVATTDYAGVSTAIIARDNIVATQFHIEKSGPVGLRMLANFTRSGGQC
jgi:imidazole glycerol-phosphate synthase subunit HisH